MTIGAGSTLYLAETRIHTPHLWLVLTDPPDGISGRIISVMVRTVKSFTDGTLILVEGDHPFIRHPSSVHYSTANFFLVSAIMKAETNGLCHQKENMSADLLARVRKGLIESPYTAKYIKEYCLPLF